MPKWLDNTLIKGPQFALVTTEEMFHELCDELDIPKAHQGDWLFGGRAATHWFPALDASIVTILPRDKNTDAVGIVGTLVHEGTHVWQFYCESIGEKEPSREFMAYSIQAIVVQLMQAYDEQTLTQELDGEQDRQVS